MDPNLIAPFIKSARAIFETMMHMPVDFGTPVVKDRSNPSFDVSGIIAFSGDLDGSVNLSFSSATAMRVVSIFTGTEVSTVGPDLIDAIGELTNMIAGGAKQSLGGPRRITVSCPTVALSGGYPHDDDKTFVVIPCDTDCGDFAVVVFVEASPHPSQTGSALP